MADRMVWMSVHEAAEELGGDAADVFEAVAAGRLEQKPRVDGEKIQVRFPQRSA